MSRFVEINATEALNNGTGNVRSRGFGRPMSRDQSRTPPAAVRQVEPSAESGPPKGRVVHYFLERGDAIRLRKSENAWVPSRMRVEDTNERRPLHEEDAQIQEIQKKLLSILNKISSENMDLLTDSIVSLPVQTENCMKKVIDILFQKAIDEPKFTPQYAYVCTTIHNTEVKPNDKRSKKSFKNLLTKCCQDRFYQMRVHEETMAKSLKTIDDCVDKDTKQQLQFKYVKDEMDYRKRSVGNCRFMCELYSVGILTSQTLETSMKYLIKSPNEEALECACNILKNIGKTLSHKAIFKKLGEYTSAAYKTKIPTRIRFMIEDTIELKDNDWVPRNARPNKEPVCNKRAPPNTGKPAVKKEYSPVQYASTAPAVISLKNTRQSPEEQTKTKRPTAVPKDDVRQNKGLVKSSETSGLAQPSMPMTLSDIVKSDKSSVLSRAGPQTESSNDRHSSDDENIGVEEIQKKCRHILDNITKENIVLTANNMVSLPIKTGDCMKKVVELVFQKAMDEPALTPEYARVCSVMKNMEAQSTDQEGKTSFRIHLIEMCQNAFESMFTRKREVAKDRNEVESCKDKETRKRLQSRFDQNELDHRRRSVANCRFICELLKVNVLAPPVVEMCAERLAESPKETSIECLHVILKHAGNALYLGDAFDKLRKHGAAVELKPLTKLRSTILDMLQRYSSSTCDKPPLLDDSGENHCAVPPVGDTKQPPATDEQPLVAPTVRESVPPKSNVYNTVKSFIHSVTPENLDSTINELSAHITSIDGMEKTVDLIFARANVRPNSIPELVRVCSSLKNIVANTADEQSKPVSLKKQVAARCNQVLRSGVQNGFTHKEPYAFVGELFNANVLSAHTLLEFLQIIPDKLTNRGLENTCGLLKAAGKKLEQVHNLKKTVRKLTNMVSNDAEGVYYRRSSMLLRELVELRDKKWVS